MLISKDFPKGTIILFITIITLLVVFYLNRSRLPANHSIPQDLIAVLRPYAMPLEPFTLTDQNNKPFSLAHLDGKWSFLFFGYTYCPDICPTTLVTLKQISRALNKSTKTATDFQVIFVSVDPERDKPPVLARYTAYFSQDFIALTGTETDLLNFSRQFGASHIKHKKDNQAGYLISHTGSIFLVDPKKRIVASFSPPHHAETITSQYQKIHGMP